jgi:acylphosphatase
MSPDFSAAHVLVKGRVQGVGYRFFAQETAEAHGLQGWVRNLPDGGVEAEAEGPRPALESWVQELRRGPSLARVDSVQVDWRPPARQFSGFLIR